ncbi:hypothetical protein [Neobacillus mesonae]|uniref:hypothetical protein n=1 Tax=Neobacillus mesonae TaxID=1193713 RepID=UPI002572ADEB|nr:hypothetical protein [Neobacillus mesonae]
MNYFLQDLIMILLLVGSGLIFGIIGWRQKRYAMMYGGFGHFIGVVISFILSYMASLGDPSKGIAIMILYPLLAGGGWLIGLKLGRDRDKREK